MKKTTYVVHRINTNSDKHKHITVSTDQTTFTKTYSLKWNYGRTNQMSAQSSIRISSIRPLDYVLLLLYNTCMRKGKQKSKANEISRRE